MFPVLESERLCLREINIEDSNNIFELLSNPMVTQYYGQDPFIQPKQASDLVYHFMNLHTENKGIRWGIEHKGEKRLIGTIGFHQWSPRYKRAEIGYELYPDFWGKGYASECMSQVLEYAFDKTELNRLGAIVYLENKDSIKLLEKFGFKKEGIKREYMFQGGKFHDSYSLSLLKSDYIGGH